MTDSAQPRPHPAPAQKKLCNFEKDCARSTFVTCMGCDKKYSNIHDLAIEQVARKDEREKMLIEQQEIIDTLASTEGFVPTAIRSEVMILREKLQASLRQRKEQQP